MALPEDTAACLARLALARRHFLRDLPGLDVPRLPGIYALWFEDELLYTGIARVDPSTTNNPQASGVSGRLSTYRNCRLTSDFALAVAFRFVVPNLSDGDRSQLASGELDLRAVQAMTKEWVATNVRFSVDAVPPATALAAETVVRRSGLADCGPPAFNSLGAPGHGARYGSAPIDRELPQPRAVGIPRPARDGQESTAGSLVRGWKRPSDCFAKQRCSNKGAL